MTLCAPVFSLKRFQIFGFRRNIYLPAPRLTKSHISPISAFLPKLKPSLLVCSTATSSPATLLHTARPRLSRQVIHTRPPSSSSFHIPHALTASASATPSTQITDPSHYQKSHFPSFRLPFQVETFTPCLQHRRLLAGDPPSRCSASPIQAGNPHPTPILLLPHPTCPDRWFDTFHQNH